MRKGKSPREKKMLTVDKMERVDPCLTVSHLFSHGLSVEVILFLSFPVLAWRKLMNHFSHIARPKEMNSITSRQTLDEEKIEREMGQGSVEEECKRCKLCPQPPFL